MPEYRIDMTIARSTSVPQNRSEMVDAWKGLMAEMFPNRGDASLLADHFERFVGNKKRRRDKANSTSAWMRRIIGAWNTVVPTSTTAEVFARAARATRHQWFAAPIAMFAASHFADFVFLFDEVRRSGSIPSPRLVELATTTFSATKYGTNRLIKGDIARIADLKQELLQNPGDRKYLRKLITNEKKDIERIYATIAAAERSERKVWQLTKSEERAFQQAFKKRLKGAEIESPALRAAALCERHTEIGLLDRRRMVLEVIIYFLAYYR